MEKANSKFLAVFEEYDKPPKEAVERADAIMRNGEMFRYATKPSETDLAEKDFAKYMGMEYALGTNSCSSAIMITLLAMGVKPGDKVLMPAFTFTAVPGVIVNIGAQPILVECNDDFRVDINDLEKKIKANPDAKVFLLSYMRGYTSDLDAIMPLCDKHGIAVLEDAAHSLGSRWNGKLTGTFGVASCVSFQSNKIINAGEGGMIATNAEELIAKAIFFSGAYDALSARHYFSERISTIIEGYRGTIAPYNVRMNNVTAALMRPQIPFIEPKAEKFRADYTYLRKGLEALDDIEFPAEDPREIRVPDSIQFRAKDFSSVQVGLLAREAKELGIPLSPLADSVNSRYFPNWKYIKGAPQELPMTKQALVTAFDMRLTSALTREHLDYMVQVVRESLEKIIATV